MCYNIICHSSSKYSILWYNITYYINHIIASLRPGASEARRCFRASKLTAARAISSFRGHAARPHPQCECGFGITNTTTPPVGRHYLSNAACLIRPRLVYACFVVSRISIICQQHISHVWKENSFGQVALDKWFPHDPCRSRQPCRTSAPCGSPSGAGRPGRALLLCDCCLFMCVLCCLMCVVF